MVTMIASFLKNSLIWSMSADRLTSSPGSEAPNETDTKFIRTLAVMILGNAYWLNQLLATIEGEFKMKTLPIDDKIDPNKHHPGCSY